MSDTDLTDAFTQVFGAPTYRAPRDHAADLDEDTLRRSHRSMRSASASSRRNADQPREPWVDEIGVATGDHRAAS